MDDQELFDYFKKRQHQVDELPGADLWGRIEAGLEAMPKGNHNNHLKATQWIVLVAALLVVSVALNTLWLRDGVDPNPGPVPAAAVSTMDSLKLKEQVRPDSSRLPALVKFRSLRVPHKPIPQTGVAKIKGTDAYIATDSMTPKDTSVTQLNTPVVALDSPLVTTATAPGRVIVSTKKLLDKLQFDDLVNRVMEDNRDKAGTLVVVKAPGHQPFRKLIKVVPSTVALKDYYRDTIVPRTTTQGIFIKGGIIVHDSLKIVGDSIRFKGGQ